MLVSFSPRGRAAVIASDAPEHSAGPIGVGDPQQDLEGIARKISPGLWIERTPPGDRRFVYVTEDGNVSVVGVASRPAGHSAAALKGYLEPLR